MDEPDREHFKSILWCSSLTTDPSYTITPTFSRTPKPQYEDSLTATTLNSPTTIPRCLSLYKTPSASSNDQFITEVLSLYTLSTGLNGGPNLLHGGIIATLMDDTIGTLLTVNKNTDGSPLTDSTVTMSLDVKYLRPIWTPGTVVVRAKCLKRATDEKGREKFWLEAGIFGEKGEEKAFARCGSVWMGLRRREGKL